MDGISFPISWRGIDRFERQNDISVNVLGLDGERNRDSGEKLGKRRKTM